MSGQEDARRFQMDLEFVQSLANAKYLFVLATHKENYFTNEQFIEYLKYLLYWK